MFHQMAKSYYGGLAGQVDPHVRASCWDHGRGQHEAMRLNHCYHHNLALILLHLELWTPSKPNFAFVAYRTPFVSPEIADWVNSFIIIHQRTEVKRTNSYVHAQESRDCINPL
jgi:hypothetical protein